LASSFGLLGEEAQNKNEVQAKAKGGLLLGGRPEILVSSRAVLDSPILGHGSGAKDQKYVEMLNDLQAEYGAPVNLSYATKVGGGLIPTHSHLMGAWVQAGILGAILWFYLFFLAVKGIIRASSVRPALAPIIVFILTGLLWDILFSPFSNTRRVMVSMAIVIILDLLDFRVAVSKGPERTFRRRPVGRPYLRPTLRPR
jgi:O-antigen ligase